MTISDAINLFLKGYFSTCERSDKTFAAYSADLKQFDGWIAGREIQGVSPGDLESWAKYLKNKGYAAASIRRKFASLKVLFAYWVRQNALESSPIWRIRLDLSRERRLPRVLTADDVTKILVQARRRLSAGAPGPPLPADPSFLARRDLAIVELLFATGIRVGELCGVRLDDLGQDATTAIIRGKGARQRLAVMTDPRSSNALIAYLELRRKMGLDHESVFINCRGKKLSTQGVTRMLSRLAEDAKVARRVTPHMLRHTIATLLLRNGADIRVVQEFLGHSSIVTTQRYTHISQEHLTAVLRLHHPNHSLAV